MSATQTQPILHILSEKDWQQAQDTGIYRGDTLDSEGFIHCSTPSQVEWVANGRFGGRTDLLLLVIDPKRVEAEIRWEESEPGQLFPHIYGPLKLDGVLRVLPFPPGPDGRFVLPRELVESPSG
jgi:uncharacterized protein (DUF952 family)